MQNVTVDPAALPAADGTLVLDAALDYAARGWRIVPLHDRAKRPRLTAWQHAASANPETIRRWLTQCPGANIGVALGPGSNLVDIECDSPEAERDLQRLFGSDLPVTITWKAHRGNHRGFQYRPDLPGGAVLHFGAVEIRTGNDDKGAQSVLPPSVHPTGVRYEWLPGLSPDDVAVAAIPDVVVARLWNNLAGMDDRPEIDHRAVVLEALHALDPSAEYDRWREVLMALHSVDPSEAMLAEAVRWSSGCEAKFKPGEVEAKWRGFKSNGGITAGTLIHLAKQRGWVPPWQRNGHAKPAEDGHQQPAGPSSRKGKSGPEPKIPIPMTREEMLATLNRALVGRFGGGVEVARIEKLGSRGGVYSLIDTRGERITLGTAAKVLSLRAVTEAVADQTRVMIVQHKRGWPVVANSILRLATIQDVGNEMDDVEEAVAKYARQCEAWWTYAQKHLEDQAEGSHAWQVWAYSRLGTDLQSGCLRMSDGKLYLHLSSFLSEHRFHNVMIREMSLTKIRETLRDIGFSPVRLRVRDGGKLIEQRVWLHPSWGQRGGA